MYRNGYWVICVENNRLLAHRLAFLYMTGAFPPAEVDHINGDKVDNRWCNLRPATRSQNSANRPTKNRLGMKGVKARKNGRFEADIRVKGRKVYLGTFDTIAEAAAAYEKAANDVFGDFARVS